MYDRLLLLLVLGGLFAAETHAQTRYDRPLSERRVSYTIDVTLDPEARSVTGSERLTWRNTGPVAVDELQFHLYLNAFKPGSTFQEESGGAHRGFTSEEDDRWGGVTVTGMRVASDLPADLQDVVPYPGGGEDLTGRMRFIHPDDDNLTDETVMAVSLPQPVGPGETIALDIDFESILPRVTARTGWTEDADGDRFFMVAQWFPKIGVYELPGQRYVPEDAAEGRWSTHQFHANSEFYADFGTYDVTMTVPSEFVVGASGVRVDMSEDGASKTLTYRADDVHDFAWTAYADYVEFTDTWQHVEIRALVRPEHADQGQRHIDAAVASLERFDAWVGEYPYTSLTLIDGIGGSNGMEYPTLITCGTFYKAPEWMRFLELVTIHEFGHQYFYGLLASNEAEEAWLDEGMNSYVEAHIVDDAYGAAVDLPGGISIPDKEMQRLGYVKSDPTRGALFTRSWEYTFSEDYGKNSYSKPATVMLTLEGLYGWDTMREFMRAYYDRWAFRHPTTRDLQQVLEETVGEDLDWFFDQYIYGEAAVNYRIDYVASSRIRGETEEEDEPRRYRSRVRVEREGDGYLPLEIEARFTDGSSQRVTWDGTDRWHEAVFESDARLVEAEIDPDRKLWLDLRRIDNGRTVEPSNRTGTQARLRFTTLFQQVFTTLSALF